jgi:hypothetical protein
VLGFTTTDNDVYFVEGWSFYTGADPTQVSAGQYDFQTLATHELAHTVGLGESIDPNSVMYEYLSPGMARRTFTDGNLTAINTDADRYMKVAGNVGGAGVLAAGQPAPAVSGAGGSRNGLLPGAGGDETRASLAPPLRLDGLLGVSPQPLTSRLPLGSAFYQASGANVILLGGAGDDLLVGDRGRDILVGGFAADPADVRAASTDIPGRCASVEQLTLLGDHASPNGGSAQTKEETPAAVAPRAPDRVTERAVHQAFFEIDADVRPATGLVGPGADELAVVLALLLTGAGGAFKPDQLGNALDDFCKGWEKVSKG